MTRQADSRRLIADASQIGGAASLQQATLAIGADGATPRFHRLSTEVFHVRSGRLDLPTFLIPGVELFGYLRLLAGVLSGQRSLADLEQAQSEYDNHFVDSPVWKGFRGSAHHVDAE